MTVCVSSACVCVCVCVWIALQQSLLSLHRALADSTLNQTALQCWTKSRPSPLSLTRIASLYSPLLLFDCLSSFISLSLLPPLLRLFPLFLSSLFPKTCHLSPLLAPSGSVRPFQPVRSLFVLVCFISHCSTAAASWQSAADTMPTQQPAACPHRHTHSHTHVHKLFRLHPAKGVHVYMYSTCSSQIKHIYTLSGQIGLAQTVCPRHVQVEVMSSEPKQLSAVQYIQSGTWLWKEFSITLNMPSNAQSMQTVASNVYTHLL